MKSAIQLGDGRTLEVTPRIDRAARTVVLENTASGEKMELVQLGRPCGAPTNDRQVNYPDYRPARSTSASLFEADPMGFEQPSLKIEAPIFHEPTVPVLKELFPDAPSTKVPYIELPDGRFPGDRRT